MQRKINFILIISLSIFLLIIGALIYYRHASSLPIQENQENGSLETVQLQSNDEVLTFAQYTDPIDAWSISVPEAWEIETKEEDPTGEKERPNFSTTKLEFGDGADNLLTSIGITISTFELIAEEDEENLAFVTSGLDQITFNDFPAYASSRDVSTEKLYSEIHSLYVVIPDDSRYYEISGYITTEKQENFTTYTKHVEDIVYSFTPPQQ